VSPTKFDDNPSICAKLTAGEEAQRDIMMPLSVSPYKMRNAAEKRTEKGLNAQCHDRLRFRHTT